MPRKKKEDNDNEDVVIELPSELTVESDSVQEEEMVNVEPENEEVQITEVKTNVKKKAKNVSYICTTDHFDSATATFVRMGEIAKEVPENCGNYYNELK